ncbi:MAG TPA: DedA family protein [Methanoregulaceae archaeon]|nr:DedA family protein [Methanoregulaceae archaeon]
MSSLIGLLDIILHLDDLLLPVIQEYGTWTYGLLFLIIFIETGLVVTPFLPGDSLLFVAGAFAGVGVLDIRILIPLLIVAAVAGDHVNYWIGRHLGDRILTWDNRIIRPKYVRSTQDFFDRHGKKSIFLARFVPIVRTFTPFLSGLGQMKYVEFARWEFAGTVTWVCLFVGGGFFFGNIPFVRDNLTLIIILIIVASFLVIGVEVLRQYREQISRRLRRP